MTGTQAWTVGESRVETAAIQPPVVGTMRRAADLLDWQPTEIPGFWMKPLYEDAARGEKTMLMKVDAGAVAPIHTHPGELEQVYVLEGSFDDGDRVMKAGDYCCRAPDAEHISTSTEGSLVLLIYTKID